MKFGLHDYQVEMIRRVFSKFSQVKEVWIYGSRARGDYKRASDIDLCIMNEVSFSDYLSIGGELDELFIPFKFDLIRFEDLNNQKLKENIKREGKVFFEA